MAKGIAGLSLALLGADLFCKYKTEKKEGKGGEKPVLGGRVLIRKVRNHGLAFQLLDGEPKIVKGLSLAAAGLLAAMSAGTFLKKKGGAGKAGMLLMLSGAAGNLYDRLKRGYVVDYIGFETKNKELRKLTFNIGDFCLAAGAVLFGAAAAADCIKESVRKSAGRFRKMWFPPYKAR